MKTFYLPVIIVLMCISSCKKDDIANENEFNKSYEAWLNYKSSVHNSYSYTQNQGSVFGYSAEIKIGVNNGKIISRDFISFRIRPDSTHAIDTTARWHEENATLNTHGNQGGELLTLDDIYIKARTNWLKVDPKNNDIYFEANNKGMISNCGYRPKGCQDDCVTGIIISSISAL